LILSEVKSSLSDKEFRAVKLVIEGLRR
jgi:hypothetical protein